MRTHIVPTSYHTLRCGPVKRTTNSGNNKAPVTNPVNPLCKCSINLLTVCYELSDPQSVTQPSYAVLASLGHRARAHRVATLETFHIYIHAMLTLLHAYIYEIQVSYISYIYAFSIHLSLIHI